MINKGVSKDLVRYIEDNIFPKYKHMEDGHGLDHIQEVIEWSFIIADKLGYEDLNKDIIYASAAYHDIGTIESDRKVHHKASFEYVMKDLELREYLSKVELVQTAFACLEHRASHSGDYSTIYSKIVSDADRCGSLNIESMIDRSYRYTAITNPTYTDNQVFDEVYRHLVDKYGDDGYMGFNLEVTKELKGDVLKVSQEILKNTRKTREIYNKVKRDIDNETK